ncbi:MAG: LysE family transporter [Pseudomonadota bacterium]
MDLIIAFATLAVVHLAAVISPGPSFVVCARGALSSGRAAGILIAIGMAVGTFAWAVAALVGLAVVFEQAQWLYHTLRIAGGLFLIYIAVQAWRHAADPIDVADTAAGQAALGAVAAFRLGLLTQLANPKVAIFFASIFLAVLPAGIGWTGKGIALAIVTLNEFVWYTVVAIALSAHRPRAVYISYKTHIERVLAVVLGLIGVRIAADG